MRRVVAIDVETATRYPNSLCQISLVLVSNPPISLFTGLIKPPENEFDSHIVKIHGISPEMTLGSPTLEEVWPLILKYISDAKLIAHNASFDRNVLEKSLGYYDISLPDMDWDCTYQATGLKLLEACNQNKIKLDNHHDSAFDATACAKLYLGLTEYTNPRPTVSTKKDYSQYSDRKLSKDILKKDLRSADPSSFFYDKKVVFTGVLKSLDRTKAALLVKQLGGDIKTGITSKTEYVICGEGVGPSKMKKIDAYNESGYNIQLLNEDEFLNVLKNEGIQIN